MFLGCVHITWSRILSSVRENHWVPKSYPRCFSWANDNYVDGISVTHGRSPRRHIWTFAAAVNEDNPIPHNICPCTDIRNSPPPPVPDFIRDDYFCDTGSENYTSTSSTEMILSGMVLDVASTTPAVTGTLRHGSGKRSLPQLVMTLR